MTQGCFSLSSSPSEVMLGSGTVKLLLNDICVELVSASARHETVASFRRYASKQRILTLIGCIFCFKRRKSVLYVMVHW